MSENPLHPGEILLEELLERGLFLTEFARRIDVSTDVVLNICKGQKSIDPELAEKIAECLGTSTGLWLGLQERFEHSRLQSKSR